MYISSRYRGGSLPLVINFSFATVALSLALPQTSKHSKLHTMTAVNGFASGESNVVLITGAAGWLGGIVSALLFPYVQTQLIYPFLACRRAPLRPQDPQRSPYSR